MAESVESSSDESSDSYEATSPEHSTSSESSSKETTPDNSETSSSRGKGKTKKKGSSLVTTQVTCLQAKKCKNKRNRYVR